jgi:hypothetical protein
MITVKPRGSREMRCQTLESAQRYAEDQALAVGFADVLENGKIKFTYHCLDNSLNVKIIDHSKTL